LYTFAVAQEKMISASKNTGDGTDFQFKIFNITNGDVGEWLKPPVC
jgi:hypothetical protein